MLTRLIAIAVLLCAAQAFAQSPPKETSTVTASRAIAQDNSAADQFRIGPYPHIDVDVRSAPNGDPIKAQSRSRKELIRLLDAEQNRPQIVRGLPLQSDATCYLIRSYLVVRDDPKSDSTHRDGSATCVPAARFRMYSATDQPR